MGLSTEISRLHVAALGADYLCTSCRHRIAHPRGGGICSDDPLKLRTRACRAYAQWASPAEEALHVAFRLACDDAMKALKLVGDFSPDAGSF